MSALPESDELEALEIRLLLEAIFCQYGFDFRDYAYASMRRRIWNQIHAEGLESIAQFQGKVLHETACMERFLLTVTV
ncbi:MAG: protein-glutamate O-methyltransferase CheR, partial [Chthoniobacterales bacterium]